MTDPMHRGFDGDPVHAHEALQLQDELNTEMDRLTAFIGKIESSIRKTNSDEHSSWLHAQRERLNVELSRLGRMTRALETRFRI